MEWRILRDSDATIQKTLNQWKHLYQIHIHGVTSDCNGNLIVILTREKRENG